LALVGRDESDPASPGAVREVADAVAVAGVEVAGVGAVTVGEGDLVAVVAVVVSV